MRNTTGLKKGNWVEGVSGNPKGRPPKTISAYLKEYGNAVSIDVKLTILTTSGKIIEKVIKVNSGSTNREWTTTINEAIAATMIQGALSGDLGMIKEVLARTEGSVKQDIAIDSNSTEKVTIKWQ